MTEPPRKRRNIEGLRNKGNFFEFLPIEIIHYIISFFSIPDCLELLRSISKASTFGGLIYRSIYERTVIFSNILLRSFNNGSFRLGKAVDYQELKGIIDREISFVLPERFVFSYTLSHEETKSDEKFFQFFLDQFLRSERYFKLASKFELIVDLFNKQKEVNDSNNYEIKFLKNFLESDKLVNNLVNLHLSRFQNLRNTDIIEVVKRNIFRFHALQTFTLNGHNLESFQGFKLPSLLKILNLINDKIKMLPCQEDFLPEGLLCLNLSCNDLEDLKDIYFPESLEYLDLQLNSLLTLKGMSFPESLKFLNLSGNEIMIDEADTVILPPNLKVLNLLRNSSLHENFQNIVLPDSLLRLYLDSLLKDFVPIDYRTQDIIMYA
ncbi:uncharacterized protein PRCAT00002612001 [Priceomyces carsonii]|uniref:uncharacterized protein n=1 Tax=Priceomyces carsonii TaxID=28549 RepID=UPI002EDAA164|nr:unnamed protein product [Priceomyces carsonii]